MRCRYWSSVVLVATLAGCGGTHAAPLDVRAKTVSQSARVTLQQISFVGAQGTRVPGFLALSRRPGKHPAVLWLHGSGGSDQDFLVSAARWADRGGIGMTISQPNDVQTYAPLVGNAERALDVLLARGDVSEVAVAGLSAGGTTAAIVAGDDKRVRAAALESAPGRPEAVLAVQKSHADFYVQAGRDDQVVQRPLLQAMIGAIRSHIVVRWYDLGHSLNVKAYDDQLDWLASELHTSS